LVNVVVYQHQKQNVPLRVAEKEEKGNLRMVKKANADAANGKIVDAANGKIKVKANLWMEKIVKKAKAEATRGRIKPRAKCWTSKRRSPKLSPRR
jgi:hypothetical protein